MVVKRQKERDDKNKKNDQKPPVDPISKNEKKVILVCVRLDTHGLPKRASGLSFGPQVPPDSGFMAIL